MSALGHAQTRPANRSQPSPSQPSRRRQRSVRVTVAVALLLLATLVALGALLVGTLWATSVASVLGLLAGWTSVRILVNEIAQTRREAARDRAAQAQAYRVVFTDRVAEHDRFARSMAQRLAARESDLHGLNAILRLADARTAEAHGRLRTEARRTVDLQVRIDELTRELEEERADADGLAFWDGAPASTPASTVVDLLAWEERAGAAHERGADIRKQA